MVARNEGTIDNATLRGLTALHPADVTRILGRPRDRGLVQLVGWGRGARYHLDPSVTGVDGLGDHPGVVNPTAESLGHNDGNIGDSAGSLGHNDGSIGDSAESLGHNDGNIGDSAGSLGHNDGSIGDSAESLGHNDGNIGDSAGSLGHNDGNIGMSAGSMSYSGEAVGQGALRDGGMVDDPIWPTLQAMAKPVAMTARSQPEDLARTIAALCQVRSLSIRELMWLLQRDRRYLGRIIKTMVAARSLAYLSPERTRHPHQRHRTVTGESPAVAPGQQPLPFEGTSRSNKSE
jgi:hypothetical protein